jgi:hypothetical protein
MIRKCIDFAQRHIMVILQLQLATLGCVYRHGIIKPIEDNDFELRMLLKEEKRLEDQ